MSVIGMESISESRAMGYSWPEAWLGCRLYDTGCAIAKAGDAIGHAGDHLHGLCGCKD